MQHGHAVTVISSKAEKQKDIEALGARAAIGTIDDVKFLTDTFTGADAVYSMLPPFNNFDPNLDKTAGAIKLAGNYVQAVRKSGAKRVVHLSSIGAHLAKGSGLILFHHAAENIMKELPMDVAITFMRPTSFYYNLYDLADMIKGKGILGLF
ncbi:MAG: NAD(P)H-binding protein [Segetibacter sp.]